MLRSLKAIVIIGLFWLSQSLLSKESEALDLNDFVKRSHALKRQALKEGSLTPETQNNKVAKRPASPLMTNYDALLKKTFRLEDSLNNRGAEHPEFYIFISFSLPRKTLLNLLKDARKYGATLVLRGLKDGSFKKTMAELMELYKHEKGRVILDPTLFKRFNVTSVPTFLLAPRAFDLGGSKPLEHKQRGSEKINQEFLVLRGNVSPRFALTEFRKHTSFEEHAKELLQ